MAFRQSSVHFTKTNIIFNRLKQKLLTMTNTILLACGRPYSRARDDETDPRDCHDDVIGVMLYRRVRGRRADWIRSATSALTAFARSNAQALVGAHTCDEKKSRLVF